MENKSVYANMRFMEKFRFEAGISGNVFMCSLKTLPIHMHQDKELLYVLKGSLGIKVSFNHYQLKAGDFLLINSYEVHAMESEGEAAEVLLVQLKDDCFEGKEFAFDPFFFQSYNLGAVKEIKRLMIRAYLCGHESPEKSDELETIFLRMVHICDRYFQMHFYDIINQVPGSFNDNAINSQRIRDIYETMYDRFGEKLKLSDVAQSEHIDMFYASRLIKGGMGTNFQNSLNIIRTDRAETFLLGTDLPIQEVGEKAGFSSHTYFVKRFKEFFGMVPSSYRKKYKPRTYPYAPADIRQISYDRKALKGLTGELEEDKRNAEDLSYMAELADLVTYIRQICAQIPPGKRESDCLVFRKDENRVELELKDLLFSVSMTDNSKIK